MNYFEINDASNPVNLGGKEFQFGAVEFYQGKWYGILEVSDEADAALLGGPAGIKAGVRSMSREDYQKKAKKKKIASVGNSSSPSNPPKPPPNAQEKNPEQVVADEISREPVGDDLLEDILTPKGDDGEPEPDASAESADTDEADEANAIRQQLVELGVTFHPQTGLKKLRAKLEEATNQAD